MVRLFCFQSKVEVLFLSTIKVKDSAMYQFQTIAANSNLILIAFVSIDSVTKIKAMFEIVFDKFKFLMTSSFLEI